ncbi:MAG: imidazolonepropionase-like amidohydrolase/Tol biopolymer transport system component [Arenicella sp.]|jgi:imidazolonepropionase-like amidohydrolase/Tol biopolymer transport system component
MSKLIKLILSSFLITTLVTANAHQHGIDPGSASGEIENSAHADHTDADAKKEEKKKWDVANPPLETRSIPIEVSSGTWMSLDVSPDGKTIAFDLLGDIYTMSITGGQATNIASGLPWEIQPRFSPDGSQIAFISDRKGGDNIWVMDSNGENAKAISKEKFRLMNNPSWSPDGKYLVARKHFTTSRSAGTGEIWLYHIMGGDGIQLVKRSSETFQKELGEPIFSADGRYIYYSKNVTAGDPFIYAQDSNTDLFNILRYDMQSAKVDTSVSGEGGSVRPTPSPDGTQIAFVRRERTQSMLYVKDLSSGIERRIYAELDQDMQETWGVTGMYPNMDWTPDSKSLVFWAKGGIHKINVASTAVSNIPFEVKDTRDVIDPPRPQVSVAPEKFETKMPRFASYSPDGSKAVFETLGRLWIKKADDAKATRLTSDKSDRRELFPSWSRDGRSIVFVIWNDNDLASIHTISGSGGAEKKVSEDPGHYRRPRFSPDAKTIVFEKGKGGRLVSGNWSEVPGIYTIAARGGKAKKVLDEGSWPHFGAGNGRLFFTRGGKTVDLVSVNMDGLDERIHATSKLVAEYQVSPDGENLAFHENYDVHIMPMLPGPQSVAAGRKGTALPQVEVSGNGSTYMHWSDAGQQINWSLGPVLFSTKLDDLHPVETALANKQDNSNGDDDENDKDEPKFEPPTNGLNLAMTFESDKPSGSIALIGARIVSMADENGGVIENGTIVIQENRIIAIGSDIAVPAGATTIDLAGKTITPGFIDAHAHGPQGDDDIIPQQNWSAIAHLAMGVTTIHDPSSQANHIFSAAEYQRAGLQLAPRTYSTGEVVYGAKAPGFYASIESYEDAQEHVFRLAEQGAHSIKNYNQPRRDQRQQVVAAALEANIAVVAEGGSNYHMDMAMVADGNTSIEHNLPQAMIYEDVLSMYSQTQVAYTPTLVVTYGGLAADPYWRQATDVWLHPILSKHVPPKRLQANTVRRTTAPEQDFVDAVSAKTAHMLKKRGVMVSIGAHGQQQGLAAHWEMWSFVRGGFSPIEALQAATIVPARHLGFDQDLGSLEVGKLADLVVLNSNPLEEITNTDKVSMVMINGRLYEAATMNEVYSSDKKRSAYYWE